MATSHPFISVIPTRLPTLSLCAVHRAQDVAVTAVPSSANSGGISANAQRGGGRASSVLRMAVIGDAAKTPSSSLLPVDESRGCGVAIVLDNAQWLDHNRCAIVPRSAPSCCGVKHPTTFGSERFK